VFDVMHLIVDRRQIEGVFPGVSVGDFTLAILAAVRPHHDWQDCRVGEATTDGREDPTVSIYVDGDQAESIGHVLADTIGAYGISVRLEGTETPLPGRDVAVVTDGRWVAPAKTS